MIDIKIISHRGNNVSKYKSNTKEALLEALNKDYIDGVELDVRITKDKKIVIIHDPIINFVSDGSGIVKKMKYKKLLKYNFGTKENKSKIATLDEFLKSVNNNKIILIEIKESKDFKNICDITYNIIKKYNLNIYVSSFNYELIKYFSTLYKKCGVIICSFINTKKLYNHFYFNMVSYNYRNRVSKKETFIFNVSELKDLDDFYVITDYPNKNY